jgi:hypothetical protein
MPKGKRPSPETYTAPDAMHVHRALFEAGAAKVVPHAPQGAIGPPQGTFVLPKTYVAQAIKDSGGDVRKLEQLLGLEKGYLGENPVLVEVTKPSGLRMPSGNEPGANPQFYAVPSPAPNRICVTASESSEALAGLPDVVLMKMTGRELLDSLEPFLEFMIVYENGGGEYLSREHLDWFRELRKVSETP